MATGISFGEADVTRTADGHVWKGVAISTRNNVLRVSLPDGTVVVDAPGVTRVSRQSSKRWVVRFGPAEATYEVKRTNCGCN